MAFGVFLRLEKGELKMTYDEFLITMKERIQERLGRSNKVSTEKVLDNDGVISDDLYFSRAESAVKPIRHLNAYYDLYQGEMTFDDIMDEIMEAYEWNENGFEVWTEGMGDLEKIKDSIIYKLVNVDRNKTLIDSVPHIYYQDLAVVFCVYMDTENNTITILIRKEDMKRWGVTEQELFNLADRNTQLILPAEIKGIEVVMKEIAKTNMGESYSDEVISELMQSEEKEQFMYVLSNRKWLYGSACILYKDIMKDFSEHCKSNLIVVFSSIHEVLLLPDNSNTNIEELRKITKMINQIEVPEEDVLSNEIYYYSRKSKTLALAKNGKTGFFS